MIMRTFSSKRSKGPCGGGIERQIYGHDVWKMRPNHVPWIAIFFSHEHEFENLSVIQDL